jgi:hypothetical protein
MRGVRDGAGKVKKEAARNELGLLRMEKVFKIVDDWQTVFIGFALVTAAYFLGWTIRRLKPRPPFASAGRDAYLYLVGTTFVSLNIVAAFLMWLST